MTIIVCKGGRRLIETTLSADDVYSMVFNERGCINSDDLNEALRNLGWTIISDVSPKMMSPDELKEYINR